MCSCTGGESVEAPDADADEKEVGDELSIEFIGDELQFDSPLWSDSPREPHAAAGASVDSSSAHSLIKDIGSHSSSSARRTTEESNSPSHEATSLGTAVLHPSVSLSSLPASDVGDTGLTSESVAESVTENVVGPGTSTPSSGTPFSGV